MKKYAVLAIILIIFNSCAITFDKVSIDNALKAKTKAIELISFGENSYYDYESRIDSFKVEINRYYLYEKQKKNNKVTSELWKKARKLLRKKFTYWAAQTTLLPKEINYIQSQIEQAFNYIIELENEKK
jgi:hypothetical protein